jgi:hypothetical protein
MRAGRVCGPARNHPGFGLRHCRRMICARSCDHVPSLRRTGSGRLGARFRADQRENAAEPPQNFIPIFESAGILARSISGREVSVRMCDSRPRYSSARFQEQPAPGAAAIAPESDWPWHSGDGHACAQIQCPSGCPSLPSSVWLTFSLSAAAVNGFGKASNPVSFVQR